MSVRTAINDPSSDKSSLSTDDVLYVLIGFRVIESQMMMNPETSPETIQRLSFDTATADIMSA